MEKNDQNVADFGNKKFESPNFYDKFQQVVKNIEGSDFFLSNFISSMQSNLTKASIR